MTQEEFNLIRDLIRLEVHEIMQGAFITGKFEEDAFEFVKSKLIK